MSDYQEKVSVVKIQDNSDVFESVKRGFKLMGDPKILSSRRRRNKT